MADKLYSDSFMNQYIKPPINVKEYTNARILTDFTNIAQFTQYETGYAFLSVITMPKFMTKLGEAAGSKKKDAMATLNSTFKNILEGEFRGMDGLPDISTENATITNGINDINMINKVTEDSSVTVSSSYFERTGSPITKWAEIYLTGIKDKRTQAKTYHGLIEDGTLKAGYENEVFTMLYFVTDNTYRNIEKAYLLTNAQLTKVENIYASQKGEYSNKELSLEWQCYPITGAKVDQAAYAILENILKTATLDSNNYNFHVLTDNNNVTGTTLSNKLK